MDSTIWDRTTLNSNYAPDCVFAVASDADADLFTCSSFAPPGESIMKTLILLGCLLAVTLAVPVSSNISCRNIVCSTCCGSLLGTPLAQEWLAVTLWTSGIEPSAFCLGAEPLACCLDDVMTPIYFHRWRNTRELTVQRPVQCLPLTRTRWVHRPQHLI